MSEFKAQDWLAAQDRPVYEDRQGRRFVGRPLSVEEGMRLQAAAARLAVEFEGRNDLAALGAMRRFARDLFNHLFPRPWWRVWERRVSSRLLAEPPDLWLAALVRFSGAPTTGAATAPSETLAAPSPSHTWSPDSSPPTGTTATTAPVGGAPLTA